MTGTFLGAIPVKPSSGEPAGQEFSPMEFDESCRRDEESGDFVSATQRWRPVKNANDETTHFIGWNLAAIPGPEDLRRLNMVEGHAVTLNDGRDWIVPVVGPYKSRLPMGFNAKGQSAVKREYRRICEQSEKLRKEWYDGGVLWPELWRFSVDLLSINYRVGPEEISSDVLDLVTTTNFTAIAETAFGIVDVRLDMESKKNTDAGQPVG